MVVFLTRPHDSSTSNYLILCYICWLVLTMGYIINIPCHNCWNSYKVFLPFPFNIDLIDIYAQANAWNQHWRKGREAICVFMKWLSLYICCVFRKCFNNLRPGLQLFKIQLLNFFNNCNSIVNIWSQTWLEL